MIEDFVQSKMLEFGITPNLVGFWRICDAMEVLHREGGNINLQDVYTEVSKKYNCSCTAVERNIRTAVQKIDFSSVDGVGKSRMRNKEFLFFLLSLVQKEERNGKQN